MQRQTLTEIEIHSSGNLTGWEGGGQNGVVRGVGA